MSSSTTDVWSIFCRFWQTLDFDALDEDESNRYRRNDGHFRGGIEVFLKVHGSEERSAKVKAVLWPRIRGSFLHDDR